MTPIEFKPNKPKVLFLILGCIFLIVSCIVMMLDKDIPSTMQVLFGLVILFFGYEIIKLLPLLLKNNDTLILSEDGIKCNMSNPVIVLPWTDISHVAVVRLNARKNLAIYVKNIDKYLEQYNTRAYLYNQRSVNTPFVINTSVLKIDVNELVKRINEQITPKEDLINPSATKNENS